jgi:acetate kinase
MNILVLNSGSSSIKFSIFESVAPGTEPRVLLDGQLSGIGTPDAKLELSSAPSRPSSSDGVGSHNSSATASTPTEAIHTVLDALDQPGLPSIHAVGYRIVHSGPKLDRHQRITPEVLADLEAAIPFAPLHEPEAVELIRAALARFDHIPHYACFDTVFHQTMPSEATTYPIPLHFRDAGVRRYGFHGLSCESVMRQLTAAGILPETAILAHLGSGCSVTTVVWGESVDTSMGLTPTGGVVMGTRPGDLDPGLLFYLLRQPGATVDSVEHMLNHDSGLKALADTSDMRAIDAASAQQDDLPAAHTAQAARLMFIESIRRAIGGMAALHAPDVIVFTGGIGEHDSYIRWAIGNDLFFDQPSLDYTVNEQSAQGLRRISAESSSVAVYVVPAQEDLIIAMHVARLSASE